MKAMQIIQIEEEFRCNNEDADLTAYASWLHNLPQTRLTRLIKASCISDDLAEVHAYFLEVCLNVFRLDKTKARA